jgi:hypothetical protein
MGQRRPSATTTCGGKPDGGGKSRYEAISGPPPAATCGRLGLVRFARHLAEKLAPSGLDARGLTGT